MAKDEDLVEVEDEPTNLGSRDDDVDEDEEAWYDEEVNQINIMIRDHKRHGAPEKAKELKRLLAGPAKPIPPRLISGRVRPVVNVENLADLEPPPRAGEGSTKDAWASFLVRVTDTDPSVAAKMTRGDIIEYLESRDIIDSEED